MGRVRNLFDVALAVGAIAGSFAVLSPQILWGESNARALTSAQAVNPQAVSPAKELPLAPFVGIAQFLKTPNNYSIVIDQQEAEVTNAALKGDRLEIDYVKTAGNQTAAGKLTGTVDSDGVFTEGITATEGVTAAKRITPSAASKSGQQESIISFAFEADGTAEAVAQSINKSVSRDRTKTIRISH